MSTSLRKYPLAVRDIANRCTMYQKGAKGPWYADFRPFREWGGRQVALCPEGLKRATRDRSVAAKLFSTELDKWMARADSGLKESDAPMPRLGDYIVRHLELRLRNKNVKPSTVETDEHCLRRVFAFFKNIRLDQITPAALDAFVEHRLRQPGVKAGTTLSHATVRNELHALSALLNRAVSEGHVATNVVHLMHEKPAPPAPRYEFLERDEAAALLDAAHEMDREARAAVQIRELRRRAKALGDARRDADARALLQESRALYPAAGHAHVNHAYEPILEALVGVLLYTGVRHDEALGLLVEDVDFENDLVHVIANEHRGLKRKHHGRRLPIWPGLRPILERHIADHQLKSTDLLFAGRNGKRTSMGKQVARVVARAGYASRPISPHTLRHTYASMMLMTADRSEKGRLVTRSTWEVAQLLGHKASAMVEFIYAHVARRPHRMEFLDYEALRRYPAYPPTPAPPAPPAGPAGPAGPVPTTPPTAVTQTQTASDPSSDKGHDAPVAVPAAP